MSALFECNSYKSVNLIKYQFTHTKRIQFISSGNIAYQKKTELSQASNTYTRTVPDRRTVDGDISISDPSYHCGQAESDRLPNDTAWWSVELGGVHIIERVVIYSKNGAYT